MQQKINTVVFFINFVNMDNLYTRKQIAVLIGKKPNYVGIYVGRGQLIEEDKRIDIDHPINKAFIAKFTAKAVNKEYEVTGKQSEDGMESTEGVNPTNVDYIKKQHEIKKLKSEISLKNLEYKKKKAKVLPLDFVIDWSGRNVRGIFGESINFGNSLIEQICNESGASVEIKLKYKKKFKQGFNEIIKTGIKNQEPEALEFAKEYALSTKW